MGILASKLTVKKNSESEKNQLFDDVKHRILSIATP